MNPVFPFRDMRIVDNFYQTSSFFPMPLIVIGTLADDGATNLGPYSLCFPYYIAGKSYYSMVLMCRNNSHTAVNILKRGTCSLNFLMDRNADFKEAVRIGFPGETTEEKMKDCIYTLTEGLMAKENPAKKYPLVVEEAFQVFECSWDSSLEHADRFQHAEEYLPPYNDFNGITSPMGAHFILRIDRILMKPKYHHAIINGVRSRDFPPVPIDYGYRDNTRFWFSKFRKPVRENIPAGKTTGVDVIMYAADRIDPVIKFTEAACARLEKVSRPFLNMILRNCVDWARTHSITLIEAEHMDQIRDKRSGEKT